MLDLSVIPVVDQHAHPLLRPNRLATIDYLSAFTESDDPITIERHASQTLFFRRSLHDLATLLQCEPELSDVLRAREALGFYEVARRCFEAAHIQTLLLDDGLLPDQILPVGWHERFARAYRLLRVEPLAETLIAREPTWARFKEAFRAELTPLPAGVLGLKSIVAYRTGLAVEPADEIAAATSFGALRKRAEREGRVRLAEKPLNDWVVWTTLEVAARQGTPVQLHTGFGDPDLDLRLANPLHLRALIEHPAFRGVPLVLLHASYPFSREAGYLAAMYPQVYVDFGLAVPSLSVAGMRAAIRALLELTPTSKILFSTDAHFIAELFYLGARWGRAALAAELQGAVHDGDLTVEEAESAAEAILRRNALRLYGLGE